jgi:ubiquinone/menaquinone biosynthesis C-methylase UbiE
VNLYHKPAEIYDSTLTEEYLRESYGPLLTVLQRRMKPAGVAKILDICCGTGIVAALLSKTESIDYLGVDINDTYLSAAREKLSDQRRFRFVTADVLSFRSETPFDIVLIVNGYHHMPDDKKGAFLENIHPLIAPGGVLIVYEMAIREFQDDHSFRKANEEYYRARIDQLKDREDITEEVLSEWEGVCAQSARREDEYKVDFDTLRRHFQNAGFAIDRTTKIWPPENAPLFDDDRIGDFVFEMIPVSTPGRSQSR